MLLKFPFLFSLKHGFCDILLFSKKYIFGKDRKESFKIRGNIGVIGKVHKKTKVFFRLVFVDILLIMFTFFVVIGCTPIFINANSFIYRLIFTFAFVFLVVYLRLPSLSNPGTINLRLIYRDIRHSHNRSYRSINYNQHSYADIKVSEHVKKSLDSKF